MLAKYETAALTTPSTLHTPLRTTKPFRHIFIITGPAGCGKSSVANYLSRTLDLPYIEGDDFHPQSNIDKMASGIPLTDDDRWSWLETLRSAAVTTLESGAPGCVVTCSALKRVYRDVIRQASRAADDVVVRFVYLRGNKELLLHRVKQRKGHYMKDDMVASQFAVLEEPWGEDDVISVDVSGTLEQVQRTAGEEVNRVIEGLA
ncbi:P-loop containing nucleoside triphosphate hydrolase protein [Pyronema omphalodes]|nr:P-loop containing nucleoside triphosphate hydrolase protein [Pyronema omphalodes]